MNKNILLGLIRHLLTTVGGIFIGKAGITAAAIASADVAVGQLQVASDVKGYVGASLALIGVIWSVMHKVNNPSATDPTVTTTVLTTTVPTAAVPATAVLTTTVPVATVPVVSVPVTPVTPVTAPK